MSSITQGRPADWLLTVVVNGKELGDTIVISKPIWKVREYDLSDYAGQEVTIDLVHEWGGRNANFGEHGFWDNIRIVKK